METTPKNAVFTAAGLENAVMTVPDGAGGGYTFHPPGLTQRGGLLVLPLESEHTEAGRGLVEAIWFNKEILLYTEGIRAVLCPCCCHITGPLFTERYLAAKAADPMSEVSAVWTLTILEAEPYAGIIPEPLPLHLSGKPELHLDHPSLHKTQFE